MIQKKSQKAVIMQKFIKHARKTPETKPLFKHNKHVLINHIHSGFTFTLV